ncbi:MAG: hypothetical protein K0Q55_2558 [Verrucomicrobia bacterium]|jgi:hypothetical protein|nr:hypothetical protein [Verrucomicrobiota bacterium]
MKWQGQNFIRVALVANSLGYRKSLENGLFQPCANLADGCQSFQYEILHDVTYVLVSSTVKPACPDLLEQGEIEEKGLKMAYFC